MVYTFRMKDFRLWHEEDKNTFNNETNIYFSQCTSDGRLSLNELLRITSDIAVEDYSQRGMSRPYLVEKGFYILVSRASFRFHRMPLENEEITVTTWEEKPEAFQLMRAYEIKNKSGDSLVSGLSSWLLVDPAARRIVPTEKFTLRPQVDIQREHDCLKPGKIIIPKNDATLIDERIIRYSDIDANGHTNNSRYGAFIMDALPKQYQQKVFTDFKINYSKEAMLGEKLSVFGYFDDEAKKISVFGRTEQGLSFESELYY